MRYLDADTLDLCREALRDGRTLDELAGKLHVEPELLGRLMQMPSDEPDLWRVSELEGKL